MYQYKKITAAIMIAGLLLQASGKVYADESGIVSDAGRTTNQMAISGYQLGDIDASGATELSDAVTALQYALKIKTPWEMHKKFMADVDGNGEVTLEDAGMLLKSALKIRETPSVWPVSEISGPKTTSFIEESDTVHEDVMTILTSKEELQQLVSNCSEKNKKEIMEKYGAVFEKYHLLAIRMQAFSDEPEKLQCHTFMNGKHILAQVIQEGFKASGIRYEGYMFICLEKRLSNASTVLSLDKGNSSRWTQVPIEEGKYDVIADIPLFQLDKVVAEADYIFRGTIVDRKEYAIDWIDEKGELWGPYGSSVLEVKINQTYYGSFPTNGDVIRVYYPFELSADGSGTFRLREGEEYIFVSKAFDEEFMEIKKDNPEDKYEHEKHADVYVSDAGVDVLSVEADKELQNILSCFNKNRLK